MENQTMQNKKQYLVLRKFFNDNPTVIEAGTTYDIIDNHKDGANREWYQSVYHYNEEQAKLIKERNSTKGIHDVKTNKLVFDFDDESTPDNAKKDAIVLCNRLQEKGIKTENIEIYYSGNKGFHVIVSLINELSPKQAKIAAGKFANDLKTFDSSLYDATQILRIPFTKNEKTNLYKIPLSFKELNSKSISEIKKIASDIDNVTSFQEAKPTVISDDLLKDQENNTIDNKLNTFDMLNRPKHFSEIKWALMNAVEVKPIERHEALMIIAATCRGLGYPLEMTKALCETFDSKFVANTKKPPVEDLESNILSSVYSETWNGGQYSIKNSLFLQNYAKRLNLEVSLDNEEPTINIDSAYDLFKDFATNIDSLTIKTGIVPLDKKLRMTIGMTVGILAPPSVGKTSISLQILNNMSKSNEKCIFFSYDMYSALVFQKLVQKHLKVTDTEIFNKFKSGDSVFQKKVIDTLKEEYKNVEFCFKTGQTPEEIEKTILYTKQKTGVMPRLIVVDYSELVMSGMSDSTAASAYVAQKLREIATKYNICVITLLQPNKAAGTPADEILSYSGAKGSSTIQQALSVMISMSRPGYDPHTPERDNYITINCLKNRMGPLFHLDLGWKGLTGEIYELDTEGYAQLKQLREFKAQQKAMEAQKDPWE